MADKNNYKSEAARVRSAARNKLSELREQRIQKRQQSSENLPAVSLQPAADCVLEYPSDPASIDQDHGLSTDDINQQAMIEGTAPEATACVSTVNLAACAPEADMEMAKNFDADDELVSDEKCGSDISKPIRDLSRLPGAGTALIWMLEQCDVHNLEDLAGADAGQLSARLGAVGQILNVQTWIDYAKENVAA